MLPPLLTPVHTVPYLQLYLKPTLLLKTSCHLLTNNNPVPQIHRPKPRIGPTRSNRSNQLLPSRISEDFACP